MRNPQLDEIIRLIPGYDPYRDAEGYRFDSGMAAKAIDFIEQCIVHVKGVRGGTPFLLEPWEKAIIANLFGWKSLATGYRRYTECLVYVPRKNGKSSLAAAIILYMLLVDAEIGAEVYCVASAEKQARIIFDIVKQMIFASPLLRRRTTPFSNGIVAIDPQTGVPTGGTFKAMNSEAASAHGLNPSCIIVDELHAHPDSEFLDALETAVGARKQPLVIHLTTADYNRDSPCNRKHDRASKVRDGITPDPTFLPVIYEARQDEDWKLESTWRKANPNFGVSVDEAHFRREIQTALDYPTEEARVRRLYLNQKTDTSQFWLSSEDWAKGNGKIDHDKLLGRECFCGLDLSSTSDLTAFVMVFPGETCVDVLCKFWIPRKKGEKPQSRDKVPYRDWVRDGWIAYAGDDAIDQDVIVEDIKSLSAIYDFRKIGFDDWNKGMVPTHLSGFGLTMVNFGQGYKSMSAPSKLLERLVLTGQLRHGSNPVLNWNSRNVMIDLDAAANIKPNKQKSTGRIDGIVSLIMALGVMDMEPKPMRVEEMIFGI